MGSSPESSSMKVIESIIPTVVPSAEKSLFHHDKFLFPLENMRGCLRIRGFGKLRLPLHQRVTSRSHGIYSRWTSRRE